MMASFDLRWLAVCFLLPLALFAASPRVTGSSLWGSQLRPTAVVGDAPSPPVKENLTYQQVTNGIQDSLLGDTLHADLLALQEPLNVTGDGGKSTYTLPGGTLVLLNAGISGARGLYGWASTPYNELGRQWIRFVTDNTAIGSQAELTSCSLAAPLTAFAYISGWYGDNLLTVSLNLSHWTQLDGNTSSISQFTQSSCQVDSDGCLRFFFGVGLEDHYPYPNNYNPQSWKGCLVKSRGIAWTQLGNNTLAPRYDVRTGVHRRNSHLDGRDVFYAIDGERDVYDPQRNATVVTMTYHVSASLDTVHWYTLLSDVPWKGSSAPLEVMDVTSTGVIVFLDSIAGVWASVDGGMTFGCCSGPPEFGWRSAASTAFDLSGRQFVMGGVKPGMNQPDVWRSNVYWTDLKSVTYYCNVTAPKDGVPGLRQWPPIKADWAAAYDASDE